MTKQAQQYLPLATEPTFDLTVGYTGDGKVSSQPAGIDCGKTCTATFTAGTKVTLTATAANGHHFTGWTGACSGMGACTITLDAAKNVQAAFTPNAPSSFALKVGYTGDGRVTSQPAGIDCGATCTATFNAGTKVTLTATAANGHHFTGWTGACSGTGACTITLDADKNVQAAFAPNAPSNFVLKVGYTGDGKVSSQPTGIDCGTTCTATFTAGTKVTLTANAANGYRFSGWDGACTGAGACVVTMDAAKTVDAIFTRNVPNTFALHVNKTGNGSVISQPAGINCGTTCTATFNAGTKVTLTATAANGHRFTGWTGACSGTGACTITLDAAKNVQAAFAPNAPGNFALKVGYTGDGKVSSQPAGIDCGATCTATFNAGTKVTLTATAANGYRFSGWDGACVGVGACVVTMDAAKTVDAIFTRNVPNMFALTISKTGTGNITSVPVGIDCGNQCTASFTAGSRITLTPAAATGYYFAGWGGACSGVGACTVTLTADAAVTATFSPQTPFASSCQPRTFSSAENDILGAYIAYYGRMADAGGLAYWVNQMYREGGGDIRYIINAFGNSVEFWDRFGAMSNNGLINNLYQQVFKRDAEPAGLTYWRTELETGRRTLPTIAIGIRDGAKNDDSAVLKNREMVARHYVTLSEKTGINLTDAKYLANMLDRVDADSASVENICQALTQRLQ